MEDKQVERPRDTIASHSFGAALIGWVMAEKEDLDSDKIVKMLIMHDLIMGYVEDYTPEDEEFSSKKEKEVFDQLIDDIPNEIEEEFKLMFHELQSQETEEAKIAKESDKLDTLLQARSYSKKSKGEFLDEFLESYREYFSSKTGKSLVEELESERTD